MRQEARRLTSAGEVSALQQAANLQVVPNICACAWSLGLPLSPWTLLTALWMGGYVYWDQAVTNGANTPWSISLHGGPGGGMDEDAVRWARWLAAAPGSWFRLYHTVLLKRTESVQGENNKGDSPVCTSIPKTACSLSPHLEFLFKEYRRNASPLEMHLKWLWVTYATAFPPRPGPRFKAENGHYLRLFPRPPPLSLVGRDASAGPNGSKLNKIEETDSQWCCLLYHNVQFNPGEKGRAAKEEDRKW